MKTQKNFFLVSVWKLTVWSWYKYQSSCEIFTSEMLSSSRQLLYLKMQQLISIATIEINTMWSCTKEQKPLFWKREHRCWWNFHWLTPMLMKFSLVSSIMMCILKTWWLEWMHYSKNQWCIIALNMQSSMYPYVINLQFPVLFLLL